MSGGSAGTGVCFWALFSKNKDLRLGILFSPISWRGNLFSAKESKGFHQDIFTLTERAPLALLEKVGGSSLRFRLCLPKVFLVPEESVLVSVPGRCTWLMRSLTHIKLNPLLRLPGFTAQSRPPPYPSAGWVDPTWVYQPSWLSTAAEQEMTQVSGVSAA